MEDGECSSVAQIYNIHGEEVSPKEGTPLDGVYLTMEGDNHTGQATTSYTIDGTLGQTRVVEDDRNSYI